MYPNLGIKIQMIMVERKIDEVSLINLTGLNKNLIRSILDGNKKDLSLRNTLIFAWAFDMCAADFIDYIAN